MATFNVAQELEARLVSRRVLVRSHLKSILAWPSSNHVARLFAANVAWISEEQCG